MPNLVGRRALHGVIVGSLLAVGVAATSASAATLSSAAVARAARENGRTAAQIRALLADTTARLQPSGRIYYVDPAPTSPRRAAAPAAAPYPYAQTFALHSRPGSNHVIYLDFDGQTITGTAWNNNATYGTGASYVAAPFSLDATPGSFSTAEQDVIQSVWQRVSEDYAPFDVDVTTQDPGAAAIDRTSASDAVFGTRALITDAPEVGSTCSCGGVAYLGVFDTPSQHAFYQPALIFPQNLGNGAKAIAEAAAHEVGHNFSLSHDATASVGYYAGQGSWAPIMGVGYDKPITQWSKGEYAGANNTEDDLALIASHGAPLVADDAGDTTATAVDKGAAATLNVAGLISTDADVDMYKVGAVAGSATFTVNPAPTSPDLDAQLRLLNGAGTVIATANPVSATTSSDVASGMSTTIATTIPSAGTYYLAVDGVGALDPATTGYSGYASLGRYTLTATNTVGPANNDLAAATAIGGPSGTTIATTIGATKQAGEPNHAGNAGGRSIWFAWTAPATGPVSFDTIGSGFDTLLGAYTGTAVGSLTAIASNNDAVGLQSRVVFTAAAGTTYRIAVDGSGGAAGAVTLHWRQPANDNLADAIALGGATGTATASTVNATREVGEPNHAGNAGGRSIWFTWTAPRSGTLTLDTIGSSFDTLLGVYTGGAVGALTTKASNDDIASSNVQSKVVVAVTSGTVYRVAVDGYDGASGAVTLHWSLP